MSGFGIDPRLSGESVPLATLPLCEALLRDDARTPWVILVPRREAAVELHDLAEADQVQLMAEIAAVSAALADVSGAHKINTGALGNMVRQLHVHVVARNEGDFAWPGPVWGVGERIAMDVAERDRLAAALSDAISARL